MIDSISLKILQAVENSPAGIASLDVLESLGLCGAKSLRTILSRLGKDGKIIRLKRGMYSASPMKDAFACAQSAFNGYLGFSSALYLHKLITEVPFTITVVTASVSAVKKVGEYEFRAVALKEKAVGFERKGPYVVSSRAKTLFDCAYLPRYSVPMEKLVQAYRNARLSDDEWKEFDRYVPAGRKAAARVRAVRKAVLEG